jgi:hypothetical protein
LSFSLLLRSPTFDFFGTDEFRDLIDDDRKDGRAPFCAERSNGSRRAIAARATPVRLSVTNLLIPSNYRAFKDEGIL